jgi:hypothetical protein
MKKISILFVALCLLVSNSIAENIPLPGWAFTGGGLGNWSGSSPGPTEVNLSCSRFFSGSGGVSSSATSSNSIVTVKSSTTYQLSCMGRVTGPGSGSMDMLVGNGSGFSVFVPTVANNVPHTLYTLSFTTGGPSDPKVGTTLIARFNVSSGVPGGGAIGSFTNIALIATTLLPQLQISRTNASQVVLSWPSSFDWYVLESSSSIPATSWTTVTNSPSVNGTNLVIVLERDDARKLFRLRQP